MNSLTPFIQKYINDNDSVISLGCGICNETKGLIMGDFLGVDLYQPYIDKLQSEGINAIHYNIKNIRNKVGAASYDIVLILDVIEHMDRAAGFRLLNNVKKIARKYIIVFTIDGFAKEPVGPGMGVSAWGLGHNALQKHVSGWSRKDFEDIGYDINDDYGLNYGHKTILAVKKI